MARSNRIESCCGPWSRRNREEKQRKAQRMDGHGSIALIGGSVPFGSGQSQDPTRSKNKLTKHQKDPADVKQNDSYIRPSRKSTVFSLPGHDSLYSMPSLPFRNNLSRRQSALVQHKRTHFSNRERILRVLYEGAISTLVLSFVPLLDYSLRHLEHCSAPNLFFGIPILVHFQLYASIKSHNGIKVL